MAKRIRSNLSQSSGPEQIAHACVAYGVELGVFPAAVDLRDMQAAAVVIIRDARDVNSSIFQAIRNDMARKDRPDHARLMAERIVADWMDRDGLEVEGEKPGTRSDG